MLIITDDKLARMGVVTRAAKGSELTHEEMDKNISIALDIMAFDNYSWESSDEYEALISASELMIGTPLQLTTSDGDYHAVRVLNPNGQNLDVSVEHSVEGGAHNSWSYTDNFKNSYSGDNISSSDTYIVYMSDDDITVTLSEIDPYA